MVPGAGIEPTTFSLEGCCSIQLSYPGWVVVEVFSFSSLSWRLPTLPHHEMQYHRHDVA